MTRCRISDRDDWFFVWQDDKESILQTMISNMTSDLDAGYDYFGKSIVEQHKTIEKYKFDMDATYDLFKIYE